MGIVMAMSDKGIENLNQDPEFYSKDYYLKGCGGAKEFSSGEESTFQIFSYIFDHMGINVENKKVLDVGCGRGELCMSSARRGAKLVRGIDFSCSAIDIATDNLKNSKDLVDFNMEFYVADALKLNMDEKFDYIFLTDIIEHLYDDQVAELLSKLKLMLTPNGALVIHTLPTKEFMIYGQYIKFFIYLLKGKKYHWLTFEQQAAETHVNLHSKPQLVNSLKGFNSRVWNDFADKSFFKRLIGKTFLVRYLSSNLWAVAYLKAEGNTP
jgi:2-polyprenyl-3-methyl-5-hydroxy-6-metoxy-1,4-benzoquinol methylase